MRIDIYHHISIESAQLDRIEAAVKVINDRGASMEQVTQDILDAVKDVKAAVEQFPAAIDKLEADVTAAINKSTTMSQADKDALTQATADLRSSLTTATTALADAADGIDEAANPPGGGGTPPPAP